MRRILSFTLLFLVLAAPGFALAEGPIPSTLYNPAPSSLTDKHAASVDTTFIMGPQPEAPYDGSFEDPFPAKSWNGWRSVDLTAPSENHWEIWDDGGMFRGEGVPNHAIACRDWLGSASGYGNDWFDVLEWDGAVVNNGLPVTLTLDFAVITEMPDPDDVLELGYKDGGCCEEIVRTWTGVNGDWSDPVFENILIQIDPGEVCAGRVTLFFRFSSDGACSDEDGCATVHGACWLDDIGITGTNVTGLPSYVDFESPNDLGGWYTRVPVERFGDYARVWDFLTDLAGNTNPTKQVAFVDNLNYEPCTGSDCVGWCYGPGATVPNTTGGLPGGNGRLHNAIESPIMPWTDPVENRLEISFEAYVHENLDSPYLYGTPGIYFGWAVRSTTSGDSTAIYGENWLNDGEIYYGGPKRLIMTRDVSHLIRPGRTYFQIQLFAWDYHDPGLPDPYAGNDATPAPYFDNVKAKSWVGNAIAFGPISYSVPVPRVAAKTVQELPANKIDMSVRFDMARNISPPEHRQIDFGDSLVFLIKTTRQGATWDVPPRLGWGLDPNPVFGPSERISEIGTDIHGYTEGVQDPQNPDLWSFDLPDEHFLYFGDVLYYYIFARDVLNGDKIEQTIPESLDKFGFADWWRWYSPGFVFQAIPTVMDDGGGGLVTPPFLYWNDFGGHQSEDEWYQALGELGLVQRRDYDVFTTYQPSSGLGNGLGSAMPLSLLDTYDTVVYSCGDLGRYTLCNGDYEADGSNDLALLMQWLDLGGKNLLLSGNHLASDLWSSGPEAAFFLTDYMGLGLFSSDLKPEIDNQASPTVLPTGFGTSIFAGIPKWAYNITARYTQGLDAVEPIGDCELLAEYADLDGDGGAYPFAAVAMNTLPNGSRVITIPCDLMFTNPYPSKAGQVSSRTLILESVLNYFGIAGNPQDVTEVPEALNFALGSHPNPFNPQTEIRYTMPSAGRLTLKVFNMRGELVRLLLDEDVPRGPGSLAWDGRNDAGARVSSGVYFCEARSADQKLVHKMTLLK